MLKFQSWGVTRELPCCSKIPPSHPLAKKKRQTHNHTLGWERRKDEHKQVRGERMFSLCSDGAEVNRSKIDRVSDEEDRWSHGEGSMSRNRQRPGGERDAESHPVLLIRRIILSAQLNLLKAPCGGARGCMKPLYNHPRPSLVCTEHDVKAQLVFYIKSKMLTFPEGFDVSDSLIIF